jgi:hypothetical protein
MTTTVRLLLLLLLFAVAAIGAVARAQSTTPADGGDPPDAATTDEPVAVEEDTAPADDDNDVEEAVEGAVDKTDRAVDEVAEQVDRSPEAQKVSAGILEPIYGLAEKLGDVPRFYWIAFTVMVAGVVSFSLQLVLGKLVVLTRMSVSFSEILSDALGLAVSLVGLVLTTQAATQNSTFTASAFSVLSATLVGGLAGFIFYWWGQKQELQAARGRKTVRAVRENSPPPGPPRA